MNSGATKGNPNDHRLESRQDGAGHPTLKDALYIPGSYSKLTSQLHRLFMHPASCLSSQPSSSRHRRQAHLGVSPSDVLKLKLARMFTCIATITIRGGGERVAQNNRGMRAEKRDGPGGNAVPGR